jgi:hypothetical protein
MHDELLGISKDKLLKNAGLDPESSNMDKKDPFQRVFCILSEKLMGKAFFDKWG